MQLKLGYGAFTVTPTLNAIVFKQINKRYEPGHELNTKQMYDYILDSHTIQFQSYAEVEELKQLLATSYDNRLFTFKDVEFNLTEYSRKSVDCIVDALTWIQRFMPRTYVI